MQNEKQVTNFFDSHPTVNTIYLSNGVIFRKIENAQKFGKTVATITRADLEAAQKKTADDQEAAKAKEAEDAKIASDAAAKQKATDDAAALKSAAPAPKK